MTQKHVQTPLAHGAEQEVITDVEWQYVQNLPAHLGSTLFPSQAYPKLLLNTLLRVLPGLPTAHQVQPFTAVYNQTVAMSSEIS